jgi:hypothetical protein
VLVEISAIVIDIQKKVVSAEQMNTLNMHIEKYLLVLMPSW